MGKFNLSEAAKAILTEGSKETFAANVSAKQGMRGQSGSKPEVGTSKISAATAYGTHDAGEIGHSPEKTTDSLPDYTKGIPTATPPGATPPVGSEPMKKLKGQPQEYEGTPIVHPEDGEEDYEAIRDRKPSKLAKQTMQPNPGAHFQSYGEESEYEGEVVAEEEKHEDEAEDKKLIKKMINKAKIKEDMDALLSGENLSEDFVQKASVIFEAAVISRAEEVVAEVEAELTEQFQAAVEEIKEDLAAKVDDYLNYMVEEWMKDNEIAIEKGLRAEIVEDFIGGLRDLFAEHYIDIPTDKVDVVEELATKVEELEASLNEEISRSIELKKELNEQKKIEAIYTACEGLTQTQVEKLKSLAENVEYTTGEEFVAKLDVLKESYFKADVKVADTSALDDEVQIEEDVKKPAGSADALIESYAKTITKTLK